MLSIILNIIAVCASVTGLYYSSRFYAAIRYRPLIILPVAFFLGAVARGMRLVTLCGLTSIDLDAIADLLSVFYVLLALSIVFLFRATIKYINSNHNKQSLGGRR